MTCGPMTAVTVPYVHSKAVKMADLKCSHHTKENKCEFVDAFINLIVRSFHGGCVYQTLNIRKLYVFPFVSYASGKLEKICMIYTTTYNFY